MKKLFTGFPLLWFACSSPPEPQHLLEQDTKEVGTQTITERVQFVDVAAQAGITVRNVSGELDKTSLLEAKGGGGGFFDYDNDGDLDAYVISGSSFKPFAAGQVPSNRLYRNEGKGTFVDVTAQAGVGDTYWSMGCTAADYDNDGDLDLYITNYGANRLYRNEGDGTFADETRQAGAIGLAAYNGFQCLFGDLDNDGYPDIYVADDTTPNLLYMNRGDGSFEDISLASGSSHSDDGLEQAGMGAALGDYDNDGDFDIFVTHFSGDYNTLYRNEGGRFFRDVSYAAGVAEASMPAVGWGTGFFDYDNDGDLDLFVANGHVYPIIDDYDLGISYAQRNFLFENLGNGTFAEVALESGSGFGVEKVSRGAAFGDYDDDGDVDILVLNVDETPTLLRNEGGNRRHWFSLSTVGMQSNRDGIGARILVEAGGVRQIREVGAGSSFLSHNDLRVHVGLGEAEKVERLEIRWPSGLVQEFSDLQADRFWVLTEGEGIQEE